MLIPCESSYGPLPDKIPVAILYYGADYFDDGVLGHELLGVSGDVYNLACDVLLFGGNQDAVAVKVDRVSRAHVLDQDGIPAQARGSRFQFLHSVIVALLLGKARIARRLDYSNLLGVLRYRSNYFDVIQINRVSNGSSNNYGTASAARNHKARTNSK